MTQKAPFSAADVLTIRAALVRRCDRGATQAVRNLAMFELAVSSALRVSDLLALRVRDLVDASGRIRETGTVAQKKTARKAPRGSNRRAKPGKKVAFNISAAARAALSPVIEGREATAYVFAGDAGQPVHADTFRRLVKDVADNILGRDANDFSCHSTRRTLAAHMYRATGGDVAQCAKLLGHATTAATLVYLGVDTAKALASAREHEL